MFFFSGAIKRPFTPPATQYNEQKAWLSHRWRGSAAIKPFKDKVIHLD